MVAMEDLHKQAKGSKLNIEFDEVETYKAVWDHSANFNNAIGMIIRDLLEPYSGSDQLKLVWPRISGQFHIKDTVEHRASIEHLTRKKLKEWKHDLH